MDSPSDSGIDSVQESDYESITSSNYQHNFISTRRLVLGTCIDRRFHGLANPYPLPNDLPEQVRLDSLHFVLSTVCGGDVLAPISRKATNIVDCGCGSGAWAISVAEQFPNAVVDGLDLSPPTEDLVPDNCNFFVADLTDDPFELYGTGSVDLVQSRIVVLGITLDQWPGYVNEVFRILKPRNGWAQFLELTDLSLLLEGVVPADCALQQYIDYSKEFFSLKKYSTINSGSQISTLSRCSKRLDSSMSLSPQSILTSAIGVGTSGPRPLPALFGMFTLMELMPL